MSEALSDEELAALLRSDESDRVERKSSAADGNAIRRNICALANDLPGYGKPGVIFLGVDDDGGDAGLQVDDRLLRDLAGMRDDGNILPLPSIAVTKTVLHEIELAVIVVQPSFDTPLRYRGRTWVRVGPTVRPATLEEEHRLSERRRAADLPFDMLPGPAESVSDLDLEFVREKYLAKAIDPNLLAQNQRPLDRQLESLRLVSNGRPTHGALVAFAPNPLRWIPAAWVQFLRIDGTTITDPIRHQSALDGQLPDVLAKLGELFRAGISERTEVAGHPREVRRPDYPMTALLQLAWNAVMHRSYVGTNTPSRVYWYADRVEIISPGGLYGSVNLENIGQGATSHRNPLLAEIMHNLGFAQRFGLGIPLAQSALRQNGNPPAEFAVPYNQVVVTLRPAP